MTRFTIVLSNIGGPLNEKTIEVDGADDMAITTAVIEFIGDTPLGDGDIITIYETLGGRAPR